MKVVYGSVYGHAQRYAESFANSFNTKAISYKNIDWFKNEDFIVYFGSLYAGGVKGLEKIKGRPKNFILVTVGLSDPNKSENTKSIKKSIKLAEEKLDFGITKVFHLRGGIDYKHLKLHHRIMMRLLYMKIKNMPQEESNDETKTMINTYGGKVDFVDLSELEPIIECVKKYSF